MKSITVDSSDAGSIQTLATRLAAEFPSLNVVINNAGIMRPEDLVTAGEDLSDAEAMIMTNLPGPMRLTAALLPLLKKTAARGGDDGFAGGWRSCRWRRRLPTAP